MTTLTSPPRAQVPPPTSAGPRPEPSQRKRRRRAGSMVVIAWTGAVILTVAVVVAILAPILAPHLPTQQDASSRLLPPFWFAGGSAEYLLGTDNLGRDVLSRIIFGTRTTLLVSAIATAISCAVGTLLGLICGYWMGTWIDVVLQRVVDASLAIPSILLVLVTVGALGTSATTLTLILGFTGWIPFTRMIRAETAALRERDFVRAAKAIGRTDVVIILKHILPNTVSTVIVVATLGFGGNIVMEASLSFLGLGIQPPDVTWGYMLNEGRDYLATAWWISTFPGLSITLMVLGVLFLGDSLRDALDPRGSSSLSSRKAA